jgi:adenosylhomocysteine nucleosidase
VAAIVVLISSGSEWRAARPLFADAIVERTPLGDCFEARIGTHDVTFFHGGWGKIAAASSTQYVIDRLSPHLIINLGTCGGFDGDVEPGEIILCERTIVYDIVERMGDQAEAIAAFTTEIDLTWLAADHPREVRRTLLVSADRDLAGEELADLRERYGAIAGDWESGAIAWVAARNGVRCLVLRGVSDLVAENSAEAYNGNAHVYHAGAERVMQRLLSDLPTWIAASGGGSAPEA